MPKYDVTTVHVDSRAAHTARVNAANEEEAKKKVAEDSPEGFPEGETEILVAKASR